MMNYTEYKQWCAEHNQLKLHYMLEQCRIIKYRKFGYMYKQITYYLQFKSDVKRVLYRIMAETMKTKIYCYTTIREKYVEVADINIPFGNLREYRGSGLYSTIMHSRIQKLESYRPNMGCLIMTCSKEY